VVSATGYEIHTNGKKVLFSMLPLFIKSDELVYVPKIKNVRLQLRITMSAFCLKIVL
jgi:hypothetical protein